MTSIQQISDFYSILIVAVAFLHIISAPFVAKAARRKHRSFASFLFLSLVIGPIPTGLAIATIPFADNDMNAPQNKPQFSLSKFLGLQGKS